MLRLCRQYASLAGVSKLKLSGKRQEELSKVKEYLKTHRARMRYAWVRENRMLIGSGAMESVHAWAIQARCRLPRMRCSVTGANVMLSSCEVSISQLLSCGQVLAVSACSFYKLLILFRMMK